MNLKSFYTHKGFDRKYFIVADGIHRLGFNRTEAVFSLRTLAAEEKTEQFFFRQKTNPIALNP